VVLGDSPYDPKYNFSNAVYIGRNLEENKELCKSPKSSIKEESSQPSSGE
jgi:hypothetical protein